MVKINYDLALKIFTLGADAGARLAKFGFDPDKIHDDEKAKILYESIKPRQKTIEEYSKGLAEVEGQVDFYTQHMTAETAYRFGLEDGHHHARQSPHNDMTEETIKQLTEKTFKGKGRYA